MPNARVLPRQADDPSDPLSNSKVGNGDRRYVVALLALVALAVGLLEYEYLAAPAPPGFDTAHWLWTSYGYVGLPVPPSATVGSPYSVPPLPFLILGPIVRTFGSPLVAGMVFGGLLFAAFGLSLIHLARRYFVVGPLQLGFVGVGLFNGTILSMLFWGGYPNFLGFIFMNEAVVFLIAFARSGKLVDSLLFYGALTLTFLTHDLTFVIALGACAAAACLLLAHGRIPWRRFVGRSNLLGAALLAGTIGGYFGITRALSVAHPGLLTTNPATWNLANVGQMFAPLVTTGPLAPSFQFAIPLALTILFGVPASLVMVTAAYRRRTSPSRAARPNVGGVPKIRWVSSAVLVGIGWLTAVMVVPGVGYLAHIDTDYLRFGYFLPVPLAFLGFAALERLVLPWLTWPTPIAPPWAETSPAMPGPEASGSASAANPPNRFRRYVRGHQLEFTLNLIVILLLAVLLLDYSVPFSKRLETTFTGDTHDPAFLQAMKWLRTNPQPGGVLTENKATRWIQALTGRASFDYAPTWVLFYGWQIVNAQESYAALNGRYAITNNQLMFIYSNTTTGQVAEQPMFVELVQGIMFPVFRVQPGSEQLNGTLNQTRYLAAPDRYNPLSFFTTNGSSPTAVTSASGPSFQMLEVDQAGPGDNAWLNFSILPTPGDTLHDFTLALSPASPVSQFTHVGTVAGIAPDPTTNSFTWRQAGTLGQEPGTQIQTVHGTWSTSVGMKLLNSSAIQFQFLNPQPQAPLNFSLHLTTSGTSNPAVTLPGTLDTFAFLETRNIHFIALSVSGGGANMLADYYAAEFGFVRSFQNSEWIIMEG